MTSLEVISVMSPEELDDFKEVNKSNCLTIYKIKRIIIRS